MRRPTVRQLESAMDTLGWLHENTKDDGQLRDDIHAVRQALDEALMQRPIK